MNLPARTTRSAPAWCAVGARVRAVAPTLLAPLHGTVTEIDGVTVTLCTTAGMYVAVDVEDCRRHDDR